MPRPDLSTHVSLLPCRARRSPGRAQGPRLCSLPAVAAACLIAAAACRPGSGADEERGGDPVAEGGAIATETSAGSGAASSTSAAFGSPVGDALEPPDVAPAAPSIEAVRPDGLREVLPADAAWVALIDVPAARVALASAAVGLVADATAAFDQALAGRIADQLGDPGLAARIDGPVLRRLAVAGVGRAAVVAIDAAALRDAPPPGSSPVAVGAGDVSAVVVDDVALLGPRDVLAPGRPRGLDFASLGPVWTRLPTDAAITLFVARYGALEPDARALLRAVDAASPSAGGIALRADGGIVVSLQAPDREALSRLLGGAQVFVSQSLGALQGEASPPWQGGVAWLNLVARGVWSRVAIEVEGDASIATVAAPACGGVLANVPLAALLGAAIDGASQSPAVSPMPFVPMQAPLAACGERGAPAALPRSLVGIGGPDPAVTLLFDAAGLLRAGLPRAGGLLPFRLDDAAVAEAAGANFAGLGGLAGGEGSGAVAFEAGGGVIALLPEGAPAWAGPSAQLGRLALTQVAGYGAVWAEPGVDARGRIARRAPQARLDAVRALPSGTAFAVVVDAERVRPALAALPAENALRRSVEQSGAFVFAWDAEGPLLVVPQAAADAEALRGALSPFFEALVRAAGQRSGGGIDTARVQAGLAVALDGVRIDVVDGVVTVRHLAGGGRAALRLLIALGAPAIGARLPDTGIDIDAMRRELLNELGDTATRVDWP